MIVNHPRKSEKEEGGENKSAKLLQGGGGGLKSHQRVKKGGQQTTTRSTRVERRPGRGEKVKTSAKMVYGKKGGGAGRVNRFHVAQRALGVKKSVRKLQVGGKKGGEKHGKKSKIRR